MRDEVQIHEDELPRAVLAELPPDHIEVSDKLTLVGLASWAARNGVRAVLVSH